MIPLLELLGHAVVFSTFLLALLLIWVLVGLVLVGACFAFQDWWEARR